MNSAPPLNDPTLNQSDTRQSKHLSTDFLELSNRQAWLLVGFFTLLGLLIRVFKALKPGGLVHADEIYQSLEIAHNMKYGYGIIPWEFKVGGQGWVTPEGTTYGPARSYIFPWIYKNGLLGRLKATIPSDFIADR